MTITEQLDMAFPDVPGFKGQGWSTQETAMVVRWLFGDPAAWDQAMSTARAYPGNPHTVADTLHEQIVPRPELDAIVTAGGDPARVDWLEIAHELIERRDDPRPAVMLTWEILRDDPGALGGIAAARDAIARGDAVRGVAAVWSLAAQAAADTPDDPAMATACHLHDTGRHLASASGHLDAAREAPAGDPDDHIGRCAASLDGAHASAHHLAAHLRSHYPAEGADLDALTSTIGLARSVSDQAKTATTAHLTQTICNHLGHTIAHVKAMGDDPDPKVREFNWQHARTHLDGAAEHAGKLSHHLTDNYPAEGRHLAALKAGGSEGTVTAQLANRGYDLNPRSGMISLDLPAGTISPVPGGVADHHITVVYLGPDVDDDAFAQACKRSGEAALAMPGPLTGTAGGVGSFKPTDGSDGKVPAWAGVLLPGAERVREALEDLSASEHKHWKPHVTLAYVDPADPLPGPVPQTPVTFTHLSVHRGDDEVERFPFGAV